ncbi:sensor histidine kinase [Dactylosporangium sp. CA-152071]|uniref:sensor histidine kinase n=1 Tax=Dactylosporangium sp. CA-152071 TaxID=3239933 RepID=UPI003D8E0135
MGFAGAAAPEDGDGIIRHDPEAAPLTSLSNVDHLHGAEPAVRIDPAVAPAAVCRSLLLGRGAVVLVAAGSGLLVVDEAWRAAAVLGVAAAATVVMVSVLTRWPQTVRHPHLALLADLGVALAILAAGRPGMAYFCWIAGSAALAGALQGMRAAPVWFAHSALGYVTAGVLLRTGQASAEVTAFIAAFPVMCVLAGLGAATATRTLVGFMTLSVDAISRAQQSAAASERTRLARELHDSVAKTLRGISFAALALPTSLRRHPDLAEQLATTVSQGAEAATREARELLKGLRFDATDRPFAETVQAVCQQWSQRCGIETAVSTAPVEPPIDVRYELVRILGEALANVEQHAEATQATVRVAGGGGRIELVVGDNGCGFQPRDLTGWQADGHFGIVGMHERAKRAGGELRLTTEPGAGTTLTVIVSFR